MRRQASRTADRTCCVRNTRAERARSTCVPEHMCLPLDRTACPCESRALPSSSPEGRMFCTDSRIARLERNECNPRTARPPTGSRSPVVRSTSCSAGNGKSCGGPGLGRGGNTRGTSAGCTRCRSTARAPWCGPAGRRPPGWSWRRPRVQARKRKLSSSWISPVFASLRHGMRKVKGERCMSRP